MVRKRRTRSGGALSATAASLNRSAARTVSMPSATEVASFRIGTATRIMGKPGSAQARSSVNISNSRSASLGGVS